MSKQIEDVPDNPEWTEDDFARARPTKDVLGKEIADLLTQRQPGIASGFARQSRWLTADSLAA